MYAHARPDYRSTVAANPVTANLCGRFRHAAHGWILLYLTGLAVKYVECISRWCFGGIDKIALISHGSLGAQPIYQRIPTEPTESPSAVSASPRDFADQVYSPLEVSIGLCADRAHSPWEVCQSLPTLCRLVSVPCRLSAMSDLRSISAW